MLLKKDVEELKRLYKARFGKELSYEEAEGLGQSLIDIIKFVYKDPAISVQEDKEK